MLSSVRTALITLSQVGRGSTANAADFEEGLTAAQVGDFATALQEWLPIAEQGNPAAQFNLALMYRNGDGVQKDNARAVHWYRLAAMQGNAGAQSGLGFMYHDGEGVLKDEAEAVRWYRLAAEQGDASAQYSLGVMYTNGEGVLKETALAHMWFNISSANGNANARGNRDEIEKNMTREQIAEATQLARSCMKSKPSRLLLRLLGRT